MHLLESFAINTGAQIGKPHLYTSYVPTPCDGKYITFQPFGAAPARNYAYWQEVVDILLPSLNKNDIKIVQIGQEREPLLFDAVDMRNKTSWSQVAYLIKNGVLHLGANSFAMHAASCFQKKIVSLFSNIGPEHSGPYWSKDEDIILLNGDRKGQKYSFHDFEDPPTINTIKPEKVAESVCKLLDIEFNYPYQTLFSGKEYHLRKIELVPTNYISNWKDLGVDSIIVRMDHLFDENVLMQQLSTSPCSIVTDKPINIGLLNQLKQNVVEYVFFVNKDTDLNYFSDLAKAGITPVIVTDMSEESYNQIKLDYIDIAPIIHRPRTSKKDVEKELEGKDLSNIYYKSSCYTIQNQSIYYCRPSIEHNLPVKSVRDNAPQKVIDSPDFWENLQTKTLLEKVA